MKTFHRTDDAATVLRDGFRDGEGTYGTGEWFSGVWLSNVPLDVNEGAKGDELIAVEVPADVFTEYEWVQEPNFGYREALVPATIVNRYPRTLVPDEED
jgi:hypothetical protein